MLLPAKLGPGRDERTGALNMDFLIGGILCAGIVIGIFEMVAPKAALRIRRRLTARDSGHKANVRDWFDATFKVGPDDPNAARNVRFIGLAVVFGCVLWGSVWFFTPFGDV